MPRLLFIKLLRDLKTTGGRVLLMVLAISLSLIVFSTMLYARSVVSSNTEAGYMSTNPASARITITPGADAEKAKKIIDLAEAEPKVIDATMRSVLNLKLRSDKGNESRSMQLFVNAPDDPLNIAKFKIIDGSYPAAAGTVLIEQSSLKVLGVKSGDTITLLDTKGQPVELKISGVVRDQSLSPALEGGVGFISSTTLPLLGMPNVLDQVAMTVADNSSSNTPSRNRDSIVKTALAVSNSLEKQSNIAVEEVAVPTPYEHPHQDIANTLLTSLAAFGGLALILSAVLIATMLNGLLAAQIPQIGMMKSIGARSSQILSLYLLLVTGIAVVATALAIGPGIWLGRGLSQMLLRDALNIDVAALSITPSTVLTILLAGIAVPLVIALVPLLRASRRSVREALDDRGVSLSARRMGLLSKLVKNNLVLMATRNVFRRRARLILSAGLLATAGAIFIGGLNTMAGFQAIPGTVTDAQKWDVQLRLAAPSDNDTLQTLSKDISGVSAAELWNIVPVSIQYAGKTNVTRTYPDQGHGTVNLSAIPDIAKTFAVPKITDGRWLKPGEIGAIVLSQNALKSVPEVKVGENVELLVNEQLTTWKVVGIASELAGGACPCVTQSGYEQVVGQKNRSNIVRLITTSHDETTRSAIANSAEGTFKAANVQVQGSQTIDGVVRGAEGHSGLLVILILLIAFSIGAVGLMGLGSMMSTGVTERTREFGVMSAIGAKPSTIRRLVITEGVLIAIISFIVAILPALAITWIMGSALGNLFLGAPIPFRISLQAILLWAGIVTLGAIVATLASAYRASKLTVREALAYL